MDARKSSRELVRETRERAAQLEALREQMKKEKAKRGDGPRWKASCAEKGSLRAYGREMRGKAVVARTASKSSPDTWNIQEVGSWLEEIGFSQYREQFAKHQISGSELVELSLNDLDHLRVSVLAHRKRLLKAVAGLSQIPRQKPQVSPPDSSPLPPSNNAVHWSQLEPLSAQAPTTAQKSPNHGLATVDGDWQNPFSPGKETSTKQDFSLLDGEFDEDAERLAFQRAVAAWRSGSGGSSTENTNQKQTSSSSACTTNTTTATLRNISTSSNKDLANALAMRLDAAHASHLANLALEKQQVEASIGLAASAPLRGEIKDEKENALPPTPPAPTPRLTEESSPAAPASYYHSRPMTPIVSLVETRIGYVENFVTEYTVEES